MKEIGFWLLDKITSIFPGILLRHLYPAGKVAEQIKVELCGEMPIYLTQGTTIPRIDLYLEVVNLSNLELRLDRMLLDLWFSQPTLKTEILEHHIVQPRSIYKALVANSVLTAEQVKQIEPWATQQLPGGSIHLNIHSYFYTKIGIVEVKSKFERRRI